MIKVSVAVVFGTAAAGKPTWFGVFSSRLYNHLS